MVRCPFSTMCIICTVVSVVSVSVIVGLWTFQFLSFSNQTRSQTPRTVGHRLPECSHPVYYNVTLGSNVFSGNSSVVFECVKETGLILIHSNQLKTTTEITLSTLTGAPAPAITSITSSSQTQRLALHLSEKLKAGERYKLHAEFRGHPSEDLQHGVRKVVILCCEENKTEDHI